jgi:hypothetical protein
MHKIEVSESAFEYLKNLAEPFLDTPASVLDRIIAEHRALRTELIVDPIGSKPARVTYRMEQLPPLLHTKIERANISGKTVTRPKWSLLVEEMMREAARSGRTPKEISAALEAQTWPGERTDTGFRYVKEAGVSFQGLDANRSCRALLGLSRAFEIPIEIDFYWRENEKAHLPGALGRVLGP